MTFRRFPLAVAIVAAFSVSPAVSQTVTAPAYKDTSNQVRSSTAVVILNPDGTAASSGGTRTTAAGTSDTLAVPVQGVTGGVPQRVVGTSLSGTADDGTAGNKIACVSPASFSPITTGQRVDTACDSYGSIRSRITGVRLVPSGTVAAWIMSQSASSNNDTSAGYGLLAVANGVLSSGGFVAAPGDTTGAYSISKGGATMTTGQVSAGTASTLIAAARTGRQRITVSVGAANTCAFGNTGVTTTTGFPLQPVAGATITLDTAAALYAACSATTTVSFVELF